MSPALGLYGTINTDIRTITTINSVIADGTASTFLKTGPGSLILGGNNTFTGGIVIRNGTVRISSDKNLGAASGSVTLNGGGLLTTADITSNRSVLIGNNNGFIGVDTGKTFTLNGDITGTGNLLKDGAGTLLLRGNGNTYSGQTTVFGGVLEAGARNAFSKNSSVSLSPNTALELNRFDQTIAGLENAGTIRFGTTSAAALTVNGNYAGNGGAIVFNTVLGDSNSPTNRMIVSGNVSGQTAIYINNLGGQGDFTAGDGIMLVQVGGQSPDNAFVLQGNFMTPYGLGAVIVGPHVYTLWHNGITNPADGNWYLRTVFPGRPTFPGLPVPPIYPIPPINPGFPGLPVPPIYPGLPSFPGGGGGSGGGGSGGGSGGGGTGGGGSGGGTLPYFQPTVPVVEAYPNAMLNFLQADTLRQRVGNYHFSHSATPSADNPDDNYFFWARTKAGAYSKRGYSTGHAYNRGTQWSLRSGFDALIYQDTDNMTFLGINALYGRAATDIKSIFGNGRISSDAYGIGATATWYRTNGFYVDAQAQAVWFKSDLSSNWLGRLADNNNGFGYTVSLEAGNRFTLNDNWSFTPQAQVTYAHADFDHFKDPFGNDITMRDGKQLTGRLGLALDYDQTWQDEKGKESRLHAYGIVNLYYDAYNMTKVGLANIPLRSKNDNLQGGFSLGAEYSWDNGKYSFFGEASAKEGFEDKISHSVEGTIGFTMRW